jgi:hypothetical protein
MSINAFRTALSSQEAVGFFVTAILMIYLVLVAIRANTYRRLKNIVSTVKKSQVKNLWP